MVLCWSFALFGPRALHRGIEVMCDNQARSSVTTAPRGCHKIPVADTQAPRAGLSTWVAALGCAEKRGQHVDSSPSACLGEFPDHAEELVP